MTSRNARTKPRRSPRRGWPPDSGLRIILALIALVTAVLAAATPELLARSLGSTRQIERVDPRAPRPPSAGSMAVLPALQITQGQVAETVAAAGPILEPGAASTATPPAPKADSAPWMNITRPVDGAAVKYAVSVRGNSGDVPPGAARLLVMPYLANQYYVQAMPVSFRPNGDWAALAYLGQPQDDGGEFDLVVVIADKQADQVFRDAMSRYGVEGLSPGLSALPPGAIELDRVSVIRPPDSGQ